MKEEIKITKEDLVMWLDRPPSDDDFDLCSFLAKAVENQKKYYEENKSLQSQLKAKEEVIETIKKQLYNAINILKDVDDETNKTIMGCMTGTLSQIIELEEILSKGENK